MDGINQEIRVDPAHEATASGLPEGAAYLQIWQMAQSPGYEPDQLVPLIQQHPRIAERLLRVANSSAAGIKREITNVRRAILMIGSRGVTEFARPMAVQYASTSTGASIRTDAAETNSPKGPLRPNLLPDSAARSSP